MMTFFRWRFFFVVSLILRSTAPNLRSPQWSEDPSQPQALNTSVANDVNKHIIEGKRVIFLEAHGLDKLAKTLDMEFGKAIELLQSIKGRIVVTGVGKSGHIGAKISATLSSTGSPSIFMHAGDAGHGDLGMVTKDDAVLAISNSGESIELSHVITYVKRFEIPLITMTQKPESTLAQASTFTLTLPRTAEACSLGLAPTTSSTASLALGDAIAVSLLTARGFSATDFGVLHPGGSLGKLLLRAQDVMYRGDRIPLCRSDSRVSEALITMTNKRLGCIGVLNNDNKLVGVITHGDLRRYMSNDLPTKAAHKIMTRRPTVAHPEQPASEILKILEKGKMEHIFVVDPSSLQVQGIIHIEEIQ